MDTLFFNTKFWFYVFICVVTFNISACSDNNPEAPFTDNAAELINKNFDLESFQAETAKLGKGAPKSMGILSKYLAQAFDETGYSLDKTLYTYVTASNMGTIQMHRFAQFTHLGQIIISFSRGKEYQTEILDSGAISDKTAEILRNSK